MPRQSIVFAIATLLCRRGPGVGGTASGEIIHKSTVKAVAWSADGKLLATGSQDGFIRLTETATGKERLTLNNQGPVQVLVFSHDNSRLGVKTTGRARAFLTRLRASGLAIFTWAVSRRPSWRFRWTVRG